MKYKIIFILLLFSAISCQKKKNTFYIADKEIIQKCFDKVLEDYNQKDKNYLVQQYLDTFNYFKPHPSLAVNFDSLVYTPEQIKWIEGVLKKANLGINEIIEFENDTPLDCSNTCKEILTNLSTSEKNEFVFSTTKIYDNLIQIRFAHYRKELTIEEMQNYISQTDSLGFQKASYRGDYLFLIHDNNMVEILKGSYHSYFN